MTTPRPSDPPKLKVLTFGASPRADSLNARLAAIGAGVGIPAGVSS